MKQEVSLETLQAWQQKVEALELQIEHMDKEVKLEDVFGSFELDDKTHSFVNEELALAHLLLGDVLFAGQHSVDEGKTVVLYVLCNDIFAWACADYEPLPLSEVGPLFKAWHADKMWGSAKWCAKRRNQKPQDPVVKAMKEAGSWDDEMEALAPNTMEAETQQLFSMAAAQQRGGAT